MSAHTVDAVVIGAGPNGLVAANLLADAGWDVLVLEAADQPGGAVRTAELIEPGFRSDLFSAFYPLGAASPILRALRLGEHGLRWTHAPAVLAHVLPDDRCAVLSRELDRTAASVASFAPADGDAWRAEFAGWLAVRDELLDALFTPFPPVRSAARLARKLGVADGLRLARMLTMPARDYAEERFAGDGARLLFGGNALHADLGPGQAGSAVYGWLLSMLGQEIGFPVPAGGAGALSGALARRLAARGGRLECGREVTKVLVAGGRPSALPTRTVVWFGRAARCSPPCRRPLCTGISSRRNTCRCGCSRICVGSTGTTARSRSTGRCRGRFRGAIRPSVRPARCTLTWIWPA